MQVFFKFVILKRLHHTKPIDFSFLVQWNEFKLFRIFSHVFEWAFDFIEIMGTNRGIFSCSAKSGMEFLLSINKWFISEIIEFNVS